MKKKFFLVLAMLICTTSIIFAEKFSEYDESLYSLNFRKYPNQNIYAMFEYSNKQVVLSIDENFFSSLILSKNCNFIVLP